MLEKTLTITNQYGLHARSATKISQLAQEFEDVQINLSANGNIADANSVLDLLMLTAAKGTTITVSVAADHHEQEKAAMRSFEELINNGFYE